MKLIRKYIYLYVYYVVLTRRDTTIEINMCAQTFGYRPSLVTKLKTTK